MKSRWLIPSWETNRSIHNIDVNKLLKSQIEAILIDVDGTLLPRESKELHKDVKEWIKTAKKHFKLHLLSNNPSEKRIKEIADDLDLTYTYSASKPCKRATMKIIKHLNCRNSKIAIIGDRLFTDILIGNRLGIYTILVRPIRSDGSICNKNRWQKIEKNLSRFLGVK